jgi:hypothetical protein
LHFRQKANLKRLSSFIAGYYREVIENFHSSRLGRDLKVIKTVGQKGVFEVDLDNETVQLIDYREAGVDNSDL